MFFAKIFHFLKGYVILSVTGNNKEKFIAEAAKSDCVLFDIRNNGGEITAKAAYGAAKELPAPPADCTLTVKGGAGLPFIISQAAERKAVLAVMCVFLVIMTLGAQFIWEIDIDADKGVDIESAEAAAKTAGLERGALKWTLKKPEEIKNIILNRTDGICWCWVYIRGTKATVRLRKSVIPPEMFPGSTPCDIIAARSGIIKRVITKKGRCVVSENMAVTAGDTLISGTMDFAESAGYQVHALGTAEAYTTHKRTGIYKKLCCYKLYTGRVRRLAVLKLYKWELPLYIKKKAGFECYDSVRRDYDLRLGKDGYIGMGLRIDELREYETKKEPISYEQTVELAKNELERDISRELLAGARLVGKDCSAENADGAAVRVTVTMDFIEEIGTEKQIEEVNFIEPKNNQPAGGD